MSCIARYWYLDLCLGPMATYFPKEVGLCESSIPGSSYGVFTLQVIPEGTWMGPFQGASVPIWQLTSGSKLEQMWEVRNGCVRLVNLLLNTGLLTRYIEMASCITTSMPASRHPPTG